MQILQIFFFRNARTLSVYDDKIAISRSGNHFFEHVACIHRVRLADKYVATGIIFPFVLKLPTTGTAQHMDAIIYIYIYFPPQSITQTPQLRTTDFRSRVRCHIRIIAQISIAERLNYKLNQSIAYEFRIASDQRLLNRRF